MIKVNRQELMDEGYIILRGVIPSDELEHLREGYEALIRCEWPDGMPVDHFQPRIHRFYAHIDEATAHTVELCLGENTLGVVRQLMPGLEAGPAGWYLMCNPVRDHGPWFWHRDVCPPTEGPLVGMQMDFMANGPVYLQWNIALYDDDVFWVVPRSHKRPNTEAEDKQLAAVPHAYANRQTPTPGIRHTPLPESVCVDLKAGDAVVYTNMLLHWGSNYSAKLRRCIHMGYRGFGAPMFYHQGFDRDVRFTRYLSSESRALYQRLISCYDQECDAMEAVFRAILDKNEEDFRMNLTILHPGESWRFVCLIHLCKYVQRMQNGGDSEFSPRFTGEEIGALWLLFRPLDDALQDENPVMKPGFQIPGPTRYGCNELPEQFGINEFIASWNNECYV